MKQIYLSFLFSIYSIISFGQFDVSEMEVVVDNSNSSQFTFSDLNFNSETVFSTDGSKIYLISSGSIFQFTLNIPFDISSIDESTEESFTPLSSPYSLNFSPDGTEMFFLSLTHTYEIIKYSLSTPFDITKAKYSGDFEKFETNLLSNSFRFNNDGSKLFIAQIPDIYEFSLITPYDVSSANPLGESEKLSLNNPSSFNGFTFNTTGYKLYLNGDNNIYEYTLLDPFDISTASYEGDNERFSTSDIQTPKSFTFNNDGSQLILSNSNDKSLTRFNLTNPYDVSTAIISTDNISSVTLNITSKESTPTGLTFNNNGTKLFTVGSNDDYVTEYSLSTAFDISTATYSGAAEELLVQSQEPTPQDVQFNSDGTKMFIIGSSGDFVVEYNLSSAFDVSTATYAGDLEKKPVNSEEKYPTGLSFNNDGTKMFVVGHQAQAVLEYSLSSAYDVSTAAYSGDAEKFPIASQETTPEGILFNTDGTKMYILGSTSDKVSEYTLSTAFDVSTATYSGNSEQLDLSSEDDSPTAFAFSNDGNRLFMLGTENGTVYTYSNGETLSNNLPLDTNKPTVYSENGKFNSSIKGEIKVFNIVGQELENKNLQVGIYMVLVKANNGTVYSFKKAI